VWGHLFLSILFLFTCHFASASEDWHLWDRFPEDGQVFVCDTERPDIFWEEYDRLTRQRVGKLRGLPHIHSSGGYLGDLWWDRSEDIREDLRDAIGNWSVGFDLVDSEYDLDMSGATFNIELEAEFKPTRKVFASNVGLVQEDGYLERDARSEYVVVDGLISKLEGKLRVPVDGVSIVSNLNVQLVAEGGISFKVARRHLSPRIVPEAGDVALALLEDQGLDQLQASTNKSLLKSIGKAAKKVLTLLKMLSKDQQNLSLIPRNQRFFMIRFSILCENACS
jgi:hypothetical protein